MCRPLRATCSRSGEITSESVKKRRLPKDVYGGDLTIAYGTRSELSGFLKRQRAGFDAIPSHSRGMHVRYEEDDKFVDFILIVADRDRYERFAALAHEAAHFVFQRLSDVGIESDAEHDEPFTYYFEWVFRHGLNVVA